MCQVNLGAVTKFLTRSPKRKERQVHIGKKELVFSYAINISGKSYILLLLRAFQNILFSRDITEFFRLKHFTKLQVFQN
jgi:hypothetical protein